VTYGGPGPDTIIISRRLRPRRHRVASTPVVEYPIQEAPMLHSIRIASAAFLVTLGLGVGPLQAQTGGGQPQARTLVNACSLFTKADLARITGLPANSFSDPDSYTHSATLSECGFGFARDLSLSLSHGTRQGFDATRKRYVDGGYKVADAPGVGDAAFFQTDKNGANQRLAMLIGPYMLGMMIDVPDGATPEAQNAILVAVAKAAAAKLR
jgi:hypothetical protein